MFDINFQGSFSPGSLTKIAKDKFKGESFNKSAKKLKKFQKEIEKLRPDIRFLNRDVKLSRVDESILFTNFLNERTTSSSIKTSIHDLFSNPSIIDTPNAGEVTMNEKIRQCIELYIGPIPHGAKVFKSNLVDGLGQPKEVRVFSIMTFSEEPLQAISRIVLIDPFHLVIPSQHREGARTYTKEEMEHNTFRTNKDNALCMVEYVRALNPRIAEID